MKCRVCKNDYPETHFALKNKSTGNRATKCKTCQNEYAKKHYEKDKVKYIARAKAFSAKARQRAIEFILDYLKDKTCNRCPENDILTLDFHHLDGVDKITEVSLMINKYSIESIKKEIDKCEIICANCHRRETHKQQNTYKYKYVQKKSGPRALTNADFGV